MIETVPLERAAEAYEKMMSGEARFRMVITIGRLTRRGPRAKRRRRTARL